MTDLVSVTIRVPNELKLWAVSHAANNPGQFYSSTEVWVKAMRNMMKEEGYL